MSAGVTSSGSRLWTMLTMPRVMFCKTAVSPGHWRRKSCAAKASLGGFKQQMHQRCLKHGNRFQLVATSNPLELPSSTGEQADCVSDCVCASSSTGPLLPILMLSRSVPLAQTSWSTRPESISSRTSTARYYETAQWRAKVLRNLLVPWLRKNSSQVYGLEARYVSRRCRRYV